MSHREEEAALAQQRVAESLSRLQSSVKQRQAELTTIGEASDDMQLRLAELQATEFVQEPVCVSPRPVFGGLIVFARKAFFHLFMKWYTRPLLMQINQFHSAAGSLIRDLVEANRLLGEENRRLQGRLDSVESSEHQE